MNIIDINDRYPDMEYYKLSDDFDIAIIGYCDGFDSKGEHQIRLIYSVDKIIEVLCSWMDLDDAIDYFEYNININLENGFIFCYQS